MIRTRPSPAAEFLLVPWVFVPIRPTNENPPFLRAFSASAPGVGNVGPVFEVHPGVWKTWSGSDRYGSREAAAMARLRVLHGRRGFRRLRLALAALPRWRELRRARTGRPEAR